jgi:hypothetical protein
VRTKRKAKRRSSGNRSSVAARAGEGDTGCSLGVLPARLEL